MFFVLTNYNILHKMPVITRSQHRLLIELAKHRNAEFRKNIQQTIDDLRYVRDIHCRVQRLTNMFKYLNQEFRQDKDVFKTNVWISFVVIVFNKILELINDCYDDNCMKDVDPTLSYEFLCELLEAREFTTNIITAFIIDENDDSIISKTKCDIMQAKQKINQLWPPS